MKTILPNIVIICGSILLFAYFVSDHMIFLPPRSGYENPEDFLKLTTADGETIYAVYLPNKAAKYTLLVSHGNAEDIGYLSPLLQEMRSHGFAVFAYDYHGYGLSTGKPTERNTYLDIDAAYNYLTNSLGVLPKNIVVYGHSVGAAVALDLAVREPVGAVILQGAFVTAFRVMTRIPLIPFDKFDNLKKIKQLKCPLLIIHGTVDNIVPLWHGKKLYHAATVPKYFYQVENAGHNDIVMVGGKEYWRTIQNFVRN